MSKACLYIRVSTIGQIDKASLPFQHDELVNYCKYVLNIESYEVFEDAGYSAKNTDRPKYQEMMQRIRNGEFTHLLAWKLDRISRNLKDFTEMWEELRSYGVTFVSKTEQFDTSTPMGEAMLKIILVFAELERKLTAERVKGVKLSRAEKGMWNGSPIPFGYDWDGELKINDDEAEIVKVIYKAYLETSSAEEVRRFLNTNNIKTKRGNRWSRKTVLDILRSPLYKGTLRFNYRKVGGMKKKKNEWIVVDDAAPKIIPPKLWLQVQDRINRNYKGVQSKRENTKHVHVFSKLLYCADCKTTFISAPGKPCVDGYQLSYYRCRTYLAEKAVRRKCDNYISDHTLGPFVLQYLTNLLEAENKLSINQNAIIDIILTKGLKNVERVNIGSLVETFGSVLMAAETTMTENKTSNTINLVEERTKSEIAKYKRAIERLENAYLFDDDSIPEKDYLTKRLELTDRLQGLEAGLRKTEENVRSNVSFKEQAAKFLITKNLLTGEVDYNAIARAGGKEHLKEFFNNTIDIIEISSRRVSAIVFSSGARHEFTYQPLTYSHA